MSEENKIIGSGQQDKNTEGAPKIVEVRSLHVPMHKGPALQIEEPAVRPIDKLEPIPDGWMHGIKLSHVYVGDQKKFSAFCKEFREQLNDKEKFFKIIKGFENELPENPFSPEVIEKHLAKECRGVNHAVNAISPLAIKIFESNGTFVKREMDLKDVEAPPPGWKNSSMLKKTYSRVGGHIPDRLAAYEQELLKTLSKEEVKKSLGIFRGGDTFPSYYVSPEAENDLVAKKILVIKEKRGTEEELSILKRGKVEDISAMPEDWMYAKTMMEDYVGTKSKFSALCKDLYIKLNDEKNFHEFIKGFENELPKEPFSIEFVEKHLAKTYKHNNTIFNAISPLAAKILEKNGTIEKREADLSTLSAPPPGWKNYSVLKKTYDFTDLTEKLKKYREKKLQSLPAYVVHDTLIGRYRDGARKQASLYISPEAEKEMVKDGVLGPRKRKKGDGDGGFVDAEAKRLLFRAPGFERKR